MQPKSGQNFFLASLYLWQKGKGKGRLPNKSIFKQNGKAEEKVRASLEKIPLALDDEYSRFSPFIVQGCNPENCEKNYL